MKLQRVAPGYAPRDAEELLDWLGSGCWCRPEWRSWRRLDGMAPDRSGAGRPRRRTGTEGVPTRWRRSPSGRCSSGRRRAAEARRRRRSRRCPGWPSRSGRERRGRRAGIDGAVAGARLAVDSDEPAERRRRRSGASAGTWRGCLAARPCRASSRGDGRPPRRPRWGSGSASTAGRPRAPGGRLRPERRTLDAALEVLVEDQRVVVDELARAPAQPSPRSATRQPGDPAALDPRRRPPRLRGPAARAAAALPRGPPGPGAAGDSIEGLQDRLEALFAAAAAGPRLGGGGAAGPPRPVPRRLARHPDAGDRAGLDRGRGGADRLPLPGGPGAAADEARAGERTRRSDPRRARHPLPGPPGPLLARGPRRPLRPRPAEVTERLWELAWAGGRRTTRSSRCARGVLAGSAAGRAHGRSPRRAGRRPPALARRRGAFDRWRTARALPGPLVRAAGSAVGRRRDGRRRPRRARARGAGEGPRPPGARRATAWSSASCSPARRRPSSGRGCSGRCA